MSSNRLFAKATADLNQARSFSSSDYGHPRGGRSSGSSLKPTPTVQRQLDLGEVPIPIPSAGSSSRAVALNPFQPGRSTMKQAKGHGPPSNSRDASTSHHFNSRQDSPHPNRHQNEQAPLNGGKMSGVRAQNREADPSFLRNSLAPHSVDKNHPTSSTPTVGPVKINRSQPQKRPLEDASKVEGRKKTRSDLFGGVGTSEGQQAIDLTDDNYAEEVGEGKGKGRGKAEKEEEEPIEEFDDEEEYGPSAPPARPPANAAPLANIPKKPKAKKPPSSPPPQATIPSLPNKATPSTSASRSSHASSSSRPLKSPTNSGSHHSYTPAGTPSLPRSHAQPSAHSSHTTGPSGGRQLNLTPNAQPNQSTSYDAHSSQRRNPPLPDHHAQSTPHPDQQPSSRQPSRPFQNLHLNLPQPQQQQQTQSSIELRRAEQASPSTANTPNPYPNLSPNPTSKPRLVQNEANEDDEVEFVASGHSENGARTSGKGKGREGHVQDQIKQFNGRAGSISDSTTTSKPKPIPPSKKLKAEAGQMPLNFGPLVNAGLAGGMKGRDGKAMQSTSSKPSNPASRRESSSSNPKPSHGRSSESSVPEKLEFPLQQVWVGYENQVPRGLALWFRPSGFHLMQDGGETRLTIPWHDLRAVRFTKAFEGNDVHVLISLELTDTARLIKAAPDSERPYARTITLMLGPRFNLESYSLLAVYLHEQQSERATFEIAAMGDSAVEECLACLRDPPQAKPKPRTTQPKNVDAVPVSIPFERRRSTRNAANGPPPEPQDLSSDPDDEPSTSSGVSTSGRKSARAFPRPSNPHEIMASWPPRGRAEINISRGDYYRMTNSTEFLNDVLIEYGIKSSLASAKIDNPSMGEAVHVFSSFLYSKLSDRNTLHNKQDPWETVRKWTSKFDIFKKKYILVPINEDLHWYLAIIVNPGAMLQAPPPPTPPKPTRAKSASKAIDLDGTGLPPGSTSSTPARSRTPSEAAAATAVAVAAAAVAAEEDEVVEIVENNDPSRASAQDATASFDSAILDSNSSITHPPDSTLCSEPISAASKERPIPDIDMEKLPEKIDELVLQSGDAESGSVLEVETAADKVVSGAKMEGVVEGSGSDAGGTTTPTTPVHRKKGYILCLDSLSAYKRTECSKRLNNYLLSEAKSRRNWEGPHTELEYVKVNVPRQSDYSSCGVYLLHYADIFLKNPEAVMQAITANKRGSNKQKEELWRSKELPEKRETIRRSIDELEVEWKQAQEEKLEEEKQEKEKVQAKGKGKGKEKETAVSSVASETSVEPSEEESLEEKKVKEAAKAKEDAEVGQRGQREAGEPPSMHVHKGKGRSLPSQPVASSAAAPSPSISRTPLPGLDVYDSEPEPDSLPSPFLKPPPARSQPDLQLSTSDSDLSTAQVFDIPWPPELRTDDDSPRSAPPPADVSDEDIILASPSHSIIRSQPPSRPVSPAPPQQPEAIAQEEEPSQLDPHSDAGRKLRRVEKKTTVGVHTRFLTDDPATSPGPAPASPPRSIKSISSGLSSAQPNKRQKIGTDPHPLAAPAPPLSPASLRRAQDSAAMDTALGSNGSNPFENVEAAAASKRRKSSKKSSPSANATATNSSASHATSSASSGTKMNPTASELAAPPSLGPSSSSSALDKIASSSASSLSRSISSQQHDKVPSKLPSILNKPTAAPPDPSASRSSTPLTDDDERDPMDIVGDDSPVYKTTGKRPSSRTTSHHHAPPSAPIPSTSSLTTKPAQTNNKKRKAPPDSSASTSVPSAVLPQGRPEVIIDLPSQQPIASAQLTPSVSASYASKAAYTQPSKKPAAEHVGSPMPRTAQGAGVNDMKISPPVFSSAVPATATRILNKADEAQSARQKKKEEGKKRKAKGGAGAGEGSLKGKKQSSNGEGVSKDSAIELADDSDD